MFVVWLLGRMGVIDAPFSRSLLFSAFVLGFVVPCGAYFGFLLGCTDPVLTACDDCVVLRSIVFPWRTAELNKAEIQDVQADWRPRTSHARLVFTVTEECFARERTNRVWINCRDNRLAFEFSNVSATPDDAAAEIRRILRLHQTPAAVT
jgi:hypothetical protein